MMVAQQVLNFALQLAGAVTEQQSKMLEVLCMTSTAALTARLRSGLTPEDCGNDFVTAAGLMALAALAGVSADVPTEQITAGDFSVRKGTVSYDGAAAGLQAQAEQIMAPYLVDRFSFQGV